MSSALQAGASPERFALVVANAPPARSQMVSAMEWFGIRTPTVPSEASICFGRPSMAGSTTVSGPGQKVRSSASVRSSGRSVTSSSLSSDDSRIGSGRDSSRCLIR